VTYDRLALLPVILIMLSSLIVLTSQNWRRAILALAMQYLGVFWLVALSWSLGLAAVKLVVGLVAGAILGSSETMQLIEDPFHVRSGRIFRGVSALLVWILVYSVAPIMGQWIPAKLPILWGGLLLIGMGLLQLGMTVRPLRVVLGLLTLLSGFEVLYAAVESSVLLTGLMAVVTLGLALAGTYIVAVAEEAPL
jgi:hypothetical protein